MLINILTGKAELFVEYLIGCGESKAFQAIDATIAPDESLEGDGQTCRETEDLGVFGQYALLILLALTAEEPLGGSAHNAHTQAVLAQKLCTGNECGNLRA